MPARTRRIYAKARPYGSFAALPLFLIWMQLSWQILLFGGELSFAYQNRSKFAVERELLSISSGQRRKVMLAIMLVVARAFCRREEAPGAEEIRCRLNLPTRIVNDVLYELVKAGLLAPVAQEEAERDVCFIPARDLGTLTVYGVLEAARRPALPLSRQFFLLGETSPHPDAHCNGKISDGLARASSRA